MTDPYETVEFRTPLYYSDGPGGPHVITPECLAVKTADAVEAWLDERDGEVGEDDDMRGLASIYFRHLVSGEWADFIPVANMVHPETHEPYEFAGEVLGEVEDMAVEYALEELGLCQS